MPNFKRDLENWGDVQEELKALYTNSATIDMEMPCMKCDNVFNVKEYVVKYPNVDFYRITKLCSTCREEVRLKIERSNAKLRQKKSKHVDTRNKAFFYSREGSFVEVLQENNASEIEIYAPKGLVLTSISPGRVRINFG